MADDVVYGVYDELAPMGLSMAAMQIAPSYMAQAAMFGLDEVRAATGTMQSVDPDSIGSNVGRGIGVIAPMAFGAFSGVLRSTATRGTATIFRYAGGQGGHFSVLVEAGGEALHTHQRIVSSAATVIEEASGLGRVTAQATIALPDAGAAMRYQRSVMRGLQAAYDPMLNNCAQHCASVVRAGGANAPSRMTQLLAWWRSIQ